MILEGGAPGRIASEPPSVAALSAAYGRAKWVSDDPGSRWGLSGSGIHPSRWTPDRSLVRT